MVSEYVLKLLLLFIVTEKQFEAAMTSSEKEKLFEAIGYRENAIATELPEHFIANFIDFELNSLEVSVKSEVMSLSSPLSIENFKNIMKFKLKNVNCVIEQRPAASAIK
jgi:vacuolar protein sorting-associated protein 13A/C